MDTGDYISISIAGAALLLSIGLAIWQIRSHGRSDEAELKHEKFKVYENARVKDSGLQVSLTVRNTGPSVAYDPEIWSTDSDGNLLLHRFGQSGIPGGFRLDPGEPVRLGADLPAYPTNGRLHIWIGWRDMRGPQERDTGVRIIEGEVETIPP